MRALPRAVARAAALLLVLLVVAGSASAHAQLAAAEPAPYARLTAAPATLALHFTEAVEDRYTRVEVRDASGADLVRSYRVAPDDRFRLDATLAPLADGVYTVRWRALSVDTHTTAGVFLVAVNASFSGPGHHHHGGGGNVSLEELHDHGPPPPAESAARGVGYLGLSLAAGIPAFVLLLGARVEAHRRGLLLVAAGGALLAAGATAWLLAEIGGRIGAGALEAASTRSGGRLALRGALLAASVLALGAAAFAALRPARLLSAGVLAVAGAASLLTALAGHAAAQPAGVAAAVAADGLHVLAAALWVGLVAALLFVLARARAPDGLREVVLRMSPVAAGLVAAVVVSGVYGTLLHIRSPAELSTTDYGRALGAKVALLFVLVGLAAANRYALLPRIGGSLRSLRLGVAVEAGAMVVVLAFAGALATSSPPAALDHAHGAGPGVAPPPEGLVHTFEEDGYNLTVVILPTPVRAGFQNLTVEVTGRGLPANAAMYVVFRAPGETEDAPLRELVRAGPARFAAEGPLFPEAGTWRVAVVLQGEGAYVRDAFDLVVAP